MNEFVIGMNTTSTCQINILIPQLTAHNLDFCPKVKTGWLTYVGQGQSVWQVPNNNNEKFVSLLLRTFPPHPPIDKNLDISSFHPETWRLLVKIDNVRGLKTGIISFSKSNWPLNWFWLKMWFSIIKAS